MITGCKKELDDFEKSLQIIQTCYKTFIGINTSQKTSLFGI